MDIINFNLRIPEDLNEEIIKISEKEGRSKNKQIEYILKQYVTDYHKSESDNNISINQNNNQGKAIVKIGKEIK